MRWAALVGAADTGVVAHRGLYEHESARCISQGYPEKESTGSVCVCTEREEGRGKELAPTDTEVKNS